MKEFSRHIVHYLSLLGILVVSYVGFSVFGYDKYFQTALAVALGVAFVVWGFVHHHIHDDLHPKIVIEYIAVAALGIVVLLSVIWDF